MPIHFVIICAIIATVAYISESWAAIWLIVACLILYYVRLYFRLVRRPQQRADKVSDQQMTNEASSKEAINATPSDDSVN